MSKTVLSWMVPAVALLMLGLMLVPAELWHHPLNDSVYRGFDPNLVYISERGNGSSKGIVEMSQRSLKLTALPASRPTVHLVNTPLSFTAAMDVRILKSANGTTPLRVGIWAAFGNHGFFLDFGPPPGHHIAFQMVLGGQVVKTKTLGSYSPGHLYRLELALDKNGARAYGRLSGTEAPPSGHRMLRLVGVASPKYFSHVFSDPVPVEAGKNYTFGGAVKSVVGAGPYGFVVEWLSKEKKRLSLSGQWHVGDSKRWTEIEHGATAPRGASFARLEVATERGGEVLFSDLFMRAGGNPRVNLLPNGDFGKGAQGWRRGSVEPSPLELLESFPISYEHSVSAQEFPELLKSLRVALTASASSQAGISSALMENYSLTLPHQRWMAVKIDDARMRALVVALLVLAAALCLGAVIRWAWPMAKKWVALWRRGSLRERLARPLTIYRWPLLMGTGAAVLTYLVLNSLLFRVGSLNADLIAARMWGYITARYGLFELYYLANVVTLAETWSGTPLQEAVFPYGPVMAYIFQLIGWVYRLFLAQPISFRMDTFQLEFLVRLFNTLFGLGDALLIYLILMKQKESLRRSLLSAGLFLFNPAVWFAGSVWGTTQSMSIFFVLAAIWLGEKESPFWAWLALAAAALTRPQMLVPALLLALLFLRKFSLKENIRAVSWTVVAVFLLLGPFSLAIAPSLPVDILATQLSLHVAGQNDAWATLVSWSALSVWPLITLFVDGKTGVNRIFHSANEPLVGGLTYWQLGNFLSLGLMLAVATRLVLRRTSAASSYDYIPVIALGTLGVLMLKTGVAAYHFIPALTLVILARRSMGDLAYYTSVGILTLTTTVTMYSIGAFWLSSHPLFSVGLFDPSSPVTRFVKEIITWDWFITLSALGNLLVLVWLGVEAVRPVVASWRPHRARARDI